MLSAKNLCFCYDGTRVIDNVSLELGLGLTVLLGPNGCGKTTLIRLLCGHLKPESGVCLLDGRPVRGITARSRARSLAYLSQRTYAGSDISVRESVLLGRYCYAGLLRSYSAEDIEAAELAMRRCGIEHLQQRSVLALSGGELQRVLLARAVAQLDNQGGRKCALVLDEPVTGLDIRYQLQFMSMVRELNGHCVVAVLHDLELAARFADRIVVMQNGRIYAGGAPEEVLSRKTLHDVWGVEGEVRFVNGQPYMRLDTGNDFYRSVD